MFFLRSAVIGKKPDSGKRPGTAEEYGTYFREGSARRGDEVSLSALVRKGAHRGLGSEEEMDVTEYDISRYAIARDEIRLWRGFGITRLKRWNGRHFRLL